MGKYYLIMILMRNKLQNLNNQSPLDYAVRELDNLNLESNIHLVLNSYNSTSNSNCIIGLHWGKTYQWIFHTLELGILMIVIVVVIVMLAFHRFSNELGHIFASKGLESQIKRVDDFKLESVKIMRSRLWIMSLILHKNIITIQC